MLNNRNLPNPKKNSTINDYNDYLKKQDIISIDIFRRIQLLGDLRNKCSHQQNSEPTKQDINDLVSGTEMIIKSVF